MNKKYLKWFLITAIIMLGLPWAAVTFAPGEFGMAICFILFYSVNPFYSFIAGFVAGKSEEKMWVLPLFPGIMFLAGAWLFFDISERIFITYSDIYIVIGYLSMLLMMLLKRKQSGE